MLQGSLDEHFRTLGKELAKHHNEIMGKMDSIDSSVNAKLGEIEAGQKLQNTLSANINKSSIEAGKSLRNIEQYIYLYGKR